MVDFKKAYQDLMTTWGYSPQEPPEPPAPPPAQPGPSPAQMQWEMIYRKFFQIEGREPYSFRELQDWWARF